ncbi:hypothetical protein PIROE2DRAFT_61428 [Piromyces sp. E2]|nr:hypothetical protein PIROE2DRAFT_61428 [Piromyces sp. E2]|eukprot:OUM63216.1 hypothetical protein PIROE2DRAFT_61428 [Piromyces sp. E2]
MASFFKKKIKGHNSASLLSDKKDKEEILESSTTINKKFPNKKEYNTSIVDINSISLSNKNLKGIKDFKDSNDIKDIKDAKDAKDTNEKLSVDEKQNSQNDSATKNTNETKNIGDNKSNGTKSENNKDNEDNIWIDVTYDPFNGIQTISDCIDLVDVDGVNQHHLVIADFGDYKNNKYMKSGSLISLNDDINLMNKKLNKNTETDSSDSKKQSEKKILMKNKVSSILLSKNDVALNDNKTGIPVLKIFKDDHVETKLDLADTPRAICSFYTDLQRGTHPTIAVAIGTTIYMYRDRFPYIKMTLPPVEANPLEEEAWKNAITKANNANRVFYRNADIKVTNISDSDLSINEASDKQKNSADNEKSNNNLSNNNIENTEYNEELHSKLVNIVTELVNTLSPLRDNGVIQLTQISIEFLALDDIETKIAFLIGNLDFSLSIERDLFRMKLLAARAYVKTFKNTLNPISGTSTAKVKMTLEVMGINVNFKIRLDIINIGNNIAKNLYVLFDYDNELFTIDKPMINIPIILPGINYTIDCLIKQNTEAYEKEINNQIKVLLCEKGYTSPLVTCITDVGMCQDLLETYG